MEEEKIPYNNIGAVIKVNVQTYYITQIATSVLGTPTSSAPVEQLFSVAEKYSGPKDSYQIAQKFDGVKLWQIGPQKKSLTSKTTYDELILHTSFHRRNIKGEKFSWQDFDELLAICQFC